MNYNLIADAGSTKTDWAVTDADGVEIKRFSTDGVNALLTPVEKVIAMLAAAKAEVPAGGNISAVYWYGAGCATPEICDRMASAIEAVTETSKIQVTGDLLGAARSLLGRHRGIACILGTGSNSCLYDGDKIVHNIPSLGYILGDEGSGTALGKRLIADTFKGHLPATVSNALLERYNLSLPEVLNKVYRSEAPNKFLASLVPFIAQHLWNPYVYNLVYREFETFLERNVSPYEGSRTLPISFTGSIAWHFADILRKAAADNGYTVGEIVSHPLDGLIKYHRDNHED